MYHHISSCISYGLDLGMSEHEGGFMEFTWNSERKFIQKSRSRSNNAKFPRFSSSSPSADTGAAGSGEPAEPAEPAAESSEVRGSEVENVNFPAKKRGITQLPSGNLA